MSSLIILSLMESSNSKVVMGSSNSTFPDGFPKVMSYIFANKRDPKELAQLLKSRPDLVEQLRTPFKASLNFHSRKYRCINALIWVCNQNLTKIARVLIKADKQWRDKLIQESANSNAVPLVSLVNQVVMKQSRIHQPGRFPTALFVAAQHTENTNCFKLLLKKGADVTVLNSKGENIVNHIITVAPAKSDADDVIAQGFDKSDPVHLLNALFNNERCMKVLQMADGLNFNQNRNIFSSKPPLFCAIVFNYYETAKLLIRNGANLNKHDDQECTALHWAVAHDDFIGIRILLRAGAKRDVRNKDGKTPIELARWRYTVKVYNDILERAVERALKRALKQRASAAQAL